MSPMATLVCSCPHPWPHLPNLQAWSWVAAYRPCCVTVSSQSARRIPKDQV